MNLGDASLGPVAGASAATVRRTFKGPAGRFGAKPPARALVVAPYDDAAAFAYGEIHRVDDWLA